MTYWRLIPTFLFILLALPNCSKKPNKQKQSVEAIDFEPNERIDDVHRVGKYASYGDFVRGGYFVETMGPAEGLRIDFLKEAPMLIEGEGTEFMDYFALYLRANLAQEFDKGGTVYLIAFNFFDDSDAFKNRLHDEKWIPGNFQETNIGNIPTIKLGVDQYQEEIYLLPIPKKYILLFTGGLNYKARNPTASNAYARRVYNLTLEMLKRVSWEQPIDQSSQEFKDWKAHLSALIEEAKKESGGEGKTEE